MSNVLEEKHSRPSKSKICAVIVTYQPVHELEVLLRITSQNVGKVVIVDNGSDSACREWLHALSVDTNTSLIANGENLGVAAGLNLGIHYAIQQSFEWVLMLDQDSRPAPDMVAQLCNGYAKISNPAQTAILAPGIVDAYSGREAPFLTRDFAFFFRRTRCSADVIEDVTTAITSGALLRVEAFKNVDGFRDDFFIDYVDTEFCLKLQKNGWNIIAVCPAKLNHRLGHRTMTKIGPLKLYPTHHTPNRWYTIGRNRVIMLKTFGLRFPHWLTYELISSAFITLRMLLTEEDKLAKLRFSLIGTLDGIRSRMGPPRIPF